MSSDSKIRFQGVVVGIEETDGRTALSVHGVVEGVECDFLLIAPSEKIEEIIVKGIGVMIEGYGRIVNKTPLIIELIEG